MKTATKSDLYRKLPSVDDLLREAGLMTLVARDGHAAVADAARAVLARLRTEISDGHLDSAAIEAATAGLVGAVEIQLHKTLSYSLRSVINATGVILHTNLGRAPLLSSALDHIRDIANTYSNLEFDVISGERGKRDVHVERLFRKLLNDGFAGEGATAADVLTIVVNNNAAAVLLALNTLADGGEVIVSRGELVEIGGSFRIPDVMSKSGAVLREVGTTNRTRIADYEKAISENTRLLLRVHRSNFQISGFTERPSLEELVSLSRKRSIPVVVARMRSNSLFRALRVDKLTYAALEATLLAYIKRDHEAIPALRMMRTSKEEIGKRAEAVAQKLTSAVLKVEIADGESVIGGGAAPSAVLPTRLLAVSCADLSADELDLRTVFPEQDDAVVGALKRASRE